MPTAGVHCILSNFLQFHVSICMLCIQSLIPHLNSLSACMHGYWTIITKNTMCTKNSLIQFHFISNTLWFCNNLQILFQSVLRKYSILCQSNMSSLHHIKQCYITRTLVRTFALTTAIIGSNSDTISEPTLMKGTLPAI